MTTSYNQFRTDIFNTVAAVSSDPSWTTEFSDLIVDRAEQRIYRDLDLVGTRVDDATGALVQNSRFFTLPTSIGTFLVVEQVNVITPAGFGSSNGVVTPLIRSTPQFIDMNWPSNSSFIGVPSYFAVRDATTLMVGSVPDQNYGMLVRGTQRPAPMSPTNQTTILTQMLPDLLFAAGMVEAGAYMRETEPVVFQTWLGEYAALLKSATVEEFRKKSQMEGWVDKLPSPAATPPRQ